MEFKMQTLASEVTLQPKSKLAMKILGELKASVNDFCPEDFERLIKKYELNESETFLSKDIG